MSGTFFLLTRDCNLQSRNPFLNPGIRDCGICNPGLHAHNVLPDCQTKSTYAENAGSVRPVRVIVIAAGAYRVGHSATLISFVKFAG